MEVPVIVRCFAVPVLMLITGFIRLLGYPKEISDKHGYRTAVSMLSQETWNFARDLTGKYYTYTGFSLFAVSMAYYFLLAGMLSKDRSIWLMIAEAVCYVLISIPVEKKLRAQFSELIEKKKADGVEGL